MNCHLHPILIPTRYSSSIPERATSDAPVCGSSLPLPLARNVTGEALIMNPILSQGLETGPPTRVTCNQPQGSSRARNGDCSMSPGRGSSPCRLHAGDMDDCESDLEEPNDAAITYPVRPFFPNFSRLNFPDLERGLATQRSFPDSLGSGCQTPNEKCAESTQTGDLFERHGLSAAPLPPKRGFRLYRYLRWNFGSVYRRIFSLVFFGNMAALAFLAAESYRQGERLLTYQQSSIAVTANILASLLGRNEHVVNALFWVFGTWTKRLPFWARKLAARVYAYGGIHSGCAVAATFWYIAFLILLTTEIQSLGTLSVIHSYIYFVSYFIVFLLVTMCISAHPRLRVLAHNWFEGIHRYMGWTATLLFWAQNILLAVDASQSGSTTIGTALLVSPNFWMLVIITLLIVYPWSRMRLRDVEAEVLSNHCVKLNFNYRDAHYGQAVRLTDAPLTETHAFAVIPNPAAPKPIPHCPGCNCHHQATPSSSTTEILSPTFPPSTFSNSTHTLIPTIPSTPITTKPLPPTPGTPTAPLLSHAGERGFSVIVSDAGDWTKKIIRNPPSKIYTRGTPQFGVMRIAGLFTPCIIVATGSGIAPCLSLFVQKPDHPVRIIWSTRNPVKTYGQGVVDLLYRTDPGAIIIDTDLKGNKRPDLVKLAYRVWEGSRGGRGDEAEGKCEAVVVISNQRVTEKVVYGLETRGVAAYGAIFDS
ncbi:hypothetical protein B0T16DRAFT_346838 [Cercophora newfieldiana]|uniref:Nonribosomal peptide synthetase 12 n=1 Tax=Cercophora newfieldiana TaxID=92897 RepID=A0AA39YJ25_9PEZI|nr:hypothetical protein B0T16DRAFT_346838 [Cercophora newfieldiana]